MASPASDDLLTPVDVSTSRTSKAGAPKTLFPLPLTGGIANGSNGWNWDVTPDGQRFLFNTAVEAGDANASAVNVVLNWVGLLKR